jgi:cell shape-determining protein MreD
MRSLRFGLLLAVVLVVQIGFMAALRPLGVVPNLVLVFVVLAGLLGTASRSLAAALVGGLLLDLTSGADFGLRLGLLVVLALATGLVHRAGLNVSGVTMALALVALATFIADAAVLAGLAGAISNWPLGHIVADMGLEIMLNLGLTLGLRPLVAWAAAESSPTAMG